MKKTKILIVCPWWGRWEVTNIHSRSMIKFMEGCPYEIKYLVIISPDDPDYNENLEIAFNSGFEVCEFRNLPVSQKLNAGINYGLENFEPEYIMNMGSDDLCDSSIWDIYKPLIEKKEPFFGVDSCHIINFYTQEAMYLDLYNDMYPVGVLRMIRVECIDKLKKEYGFNLYPFNMNSGLDTASMERLRKIGIDPVVIHTDGRAFTSGLKCNTTINHWIHLSQLNNAEHHKKAILIEFETIKHLIY